MRHCVRTVLRGRKMPSRKLMGRRVAVVVVDDVDFIVVDVVDVVVLEKCGQQNEINRRVSVSDDDDDGDGDDDDDAIDSLLRNKIYRPHPYY